MDKEEFYNRLISGSVIIIVLIFMYYIFCAHKYEYMNVDVKKYMDQKPLMGTYVDTPVHAVNDFNQLYYPGIYIDSSREYYKYNNMPRWL